MNATDIFKFLHCPHWPYYDRYATPEETSMRRPLTDAERRRQEDGVAHEGDVVRSLAALRTVENAPITGNVQQDAEATLALMRKGVDLIYQATLVAGNRDGRPDLVEKREGASNLGAWHYVPIDVKSTHELEKYQKLQLAFYSDLLEKTQGTYPEDAAIVNVRAERISFDPAAMREELEIVCADIEKSLAGEKPDPVLRKDCFETGPWGALCQHDAEAANDIALLYNVNVPKLRALRKLGVRTVQDAAGIDPATLANAEKGLTFHALDTIRRQARSLAAKEVIIRKPVELPVAPLEIHFDIESDPPNDLDYLYGVLVRDPVEGDAYTAFVSPDLENEGEMWFKFLAWVEQLPLEYVVYHFSPYEKTRLAILEARYGGSHYLDLFRSNMVDLKEFVSHSATFPLYFYSLKSVAKFLGFSWREGVKTGGESVDKFEQYLATGDRAILDSIIRYNEDDVRATAHVKDWLEEYAREITSYEQPYPWEK